MAHSSGMFALWSEATVCQHSGAAVDSAGLPIELPAKSPLESDRLLEFWLARAREGSGFRWAVIYQRSGEFTGAVGFNSLGRCSEYAYHFVPRYWGRGFASEASRSALEWSFAGGAESIESFIEAANLESIRLAERLGFRRCEPPESELQRYVLLPTASAP